MLRNPIDATHSAIAASSAIVPRLRKFSLLLISSMVCCLTGSLQAQTPVKQMNAGGPAIAPFAADSGFSAGNSFSSTATINLTGVTNPAPQAVYQTVRWNPSFNYTLTGLTAGSSYLVRIHLVELSFTANGQRLFNAAINGTSVLSNFDIFAAVGQNHALVKEFSATANTSGQIVVAFTQGSADNPSIAGIEVDTPAAAPATPTGVTATAGTTKVTLSWSASSGATTYNLYRSTSSNGEGSTAYASGLTTTGYTDTSVTAGTTYYYKVAAVNSTGTSAQSSEVNAVPTSGGTVPATPTGVTATAGTTKVTLSWSASSGATTYSVYRSTSSNGEGSTAYASGLTTTGYTDTSVTAGTTYYYKVAAVNSTGTSAQSAEVSAVPTSGGTLPPNTAVLQINAGGSAVAPFVADKNFDVGTGFSSTATINVSGVTNAAPASVYQSLRWNTSFNYTLPG